MRKKSNIRIISISDNGNEDLVNVLKKYNDVNIYKDRNGYKLIIIEKVDSKIPIGVTIKKKRGKWREVLKIIGSAKENEDVKCNMHQMSSIIAKQKG